VHNQVSSALGHYPHRQAQSQTAEPSGDEIGGIGAQLRACTVNDNSLDIAKLKGDFADIAGVTGVTGTERGFEVLKINRTGSWRLSNWARWCYCRAMY